MDKSGNPYRVLGLKKNATKDQIKAAFRKLVLKHHPDTGGDPERFKELHFAYKLLIDDARRARYDETGVVDEPKAKQEVNELLVYMARILDTIVGGLMDRDPDALKTIDIIAEMNRILAMTLRQQKQSLQQLARNSVVFLEVKERIQITDEGPNELAEVMSSRARQCQNDIQMREKDIEMLNKIIAAVNKYKYRTDAKPKSQSKWDEMQQIREQLKAQYQAGAWTNAR